MSRGAGVFLGVAGLTALAVWSARPPTDGDAWRWGFVVAALAASAVLWRGAEWAPRMRWVLLGALGLRLVAFPMTPSLSDDGFRYLWDGRVQSVLGTSPYAFMPADERLSGLRDRDLYPNLNSAGYYSVYPPASQLAFRAAVRGPADDWRGEWYRYKALLLLVECVGIWALSRIVDPRGLVLYAWHPLAVIEGAGQGHTEALLVGGLGVFLWGLARRPALAGGALAVAGWIKLYPFVFLPWVVRRAGRRGLAVFAGTAVALALPFASWMAVRHVGTSLALYAGTFDFYSAPYLALKAVGHGVIGDASGPLVATIMTVGAGVWVVSRFAVHDGQLPSALRTIALGVAGYALLTPTMHPWHWLPLLFVSPLLKHKKPIYWIATASTATYLRYTEGELLYALALVAGWGGGAWLFLRAILPRGWSGLLRIRARQKWDRIRALIPRPNPVDRILDYGCAEGFVGDLAAQETGCALDLADVVDLNRMRRPLVLIGHGSPPSLKQAYGLTLLIFVLHHAESPISTLRDAVGRSSGPVVVWESVWRRRWEKRWLERLDRLVNGFRSAGAMKDQPVRWRSAAEWRGVFEAEGLRVVREERFGWIHPQVVFVLEPPAHPSRSETEAVRTSSHE